jgi:hypothetical protein
VRIVDFLQKSLSDLPSLAAIQIQFQLSILSRQGSPELVSDSHEFIQDQSLSFHSRSRVDLLEDEKKDRTSSHDSAARRFIGTIEFHVSSASPRQTMNEASSSRESGPSTETDHEIKTKLTEFNCLVTIL